MRFISDHKARFGVEPICRVLTEHGVPIAPSTYYDAIARGPSARQVRDEQLKAAITRVHGENYGVYGARKVWLQLNREGVAVARCTVERLMREQHLAARRTKKPRSTTRPGKGRWRAPDLVRRDFPAARVNRKWNGDGTEIPADEGKLHLASVLDMGSRRVLGFCLSEHHDAQLAYGALAMAVTVRGGQVPGVILHTDQGSEYTARTFRQACQRLSVRQSMGRPGSALDKTWASYCTSWCCWGENSAGELAALALDQPRVGWVGRVEQRNVLVVGPVGSEQPGAPPGLDRGDVDTETVSYFGEGEQPAAAEPVSVAGQVVAAA